MSVTTADMLIAMIPTHAIGNKRRKRERVMWRAADMMRAELEEALVASGVAVELRLIKKVSRAA